MRECLGWMSSCSNEQSCPQNWLEYAVTEIPRRVGCHVCGLEVSLVDSLDAFEVELSSSPLAAFPTVPPIGMGPAPNPSTSLGDAAFAPPIDEPRVSSGGIDAGFTIDSVPPPKPSPSERQWVCTLANGETIQIDRVSMTIGRSRTCDIVIPSAKVSRQHASLSRVDSELWIEDLGSANGVWHNGEKVTRTRIQSGDVFTISDETLLFEAR